MTGARPPSLTLFNFPCCKTFMAGGETSRAQIKGNGPNIYQRFGSGTHLRNGDVKYFVIKAKQLGLCENLFLSWFPLYSNGMTKYSPHRSP